MAQESDPQGALIARAKSLELNTPYVPPPGDPLAHHAAGYAKTMCSAVFITGLDPAFAAENVGYFTAPYEIRARLGKPIVDRARKAVHVAVPGGARRTALFFGDQGCVTLPLEGRSVSFSRPASSGGCRILRPNRGRWAIWLPPILCRRAWTRRRSPGRRCRVRAGGGDDRRVRRDVQGADHRRAIRRGHHGDARRSRAGRWARA